MSRLVSSGREGLEGQDRLDDQRLKRLRPHRAEAKRSRGEVSAKARAGGGAPPPVEKSLLLTAVADQILSCEACPRLRQYCADVARDKRRAYRGETYWGRPVPGFGDPEARVLLIGLAPAAHGANRTGRVFTGDGIGGSGDFLMGALHRAGFANIPTSRDPNDGLVLRDAYIAAAVRCAPPDNKPTPEEIARCLPHLEAEIDALVRVRVVIALGRIGFDAYLRLLRRQNIVIRPRPVFSHAARFPLPNGQMLIASYHPSRQNTNTGTLTGEMMDAVLRQARAALGAEGSRGSRGSKGSRL
jgi:uracil-DNA glycosylase family 4